ncbi:unnamed protein product, partial [Brenthis ino]
MRRPRNSVCLCCVRQGGARLARGAWPAVRGCLGGSSRGVRLKHGRPAHGAKQTARVAATASHCPKFALQAAQ